MKVRAALVAARSGHSPRCGNSRQVCLPSGKRPPAVPVRELEKLAEQFRRGFPVTDYSYETNLVCLSARKIASNCAEFVSQIRCRAGIPLGPRTRSDGKRRERRVGRLTILQICEKLSPFERQGHAVGNCPGGGSGVGNLVAHGCGRTRGPSRGGGVVCCPLFRAASSGQAGTGPSRRTRPP
jgi:hypothetical protein